MRPSVLFREPYCGKRLTGATCEFWANRPLQPILSRVESQAPPTPFARRDRLGSDVGANHRRANVLVARGLPHRREPRPWQHSYRARHHPVNPPRRGGPVAPGRLAGGPRPQGRSGIMGMVRWAVERLGRVHVRDLALSRAHPLLEWLDDTATEPYHGHHGGCARFATCFRKRTCVKCARFCAPKKRTLLLGSAQPIVPQHVKVSKK
jgi:hypothetical protein